MGVPAAAPRLEEDGVVLRAHRSDDVAAVVEMARDAEAQRWTSVPCPYRWEDGESWLDSLDGRWRDGAAWLWAVEVEGAYAGNVELRPDGAGLVEVGFLLHPRARGRGVMSRALRTALTWAFADAEQAVAQWWAHVGNWPSRRVAWAVGFCVEGRVRGARPHRGERRDAWVGTLRAGDPLQPPSPWLDLPRIELGGLVLREHRPGDAVRMVEACADPTTQRWLPALPCPYGLPDAAEHLLSREEEHAAARGLYWAVANGDERLVAEVGLSGLTADPTSSSGVSGSGEVGYWCHPDARGNGMVTRAVRAVVRHAVLPADAGGLGLARVSLRAAAGNAASQAVAERAGFRRVGLERAGERLRDGTRVDFVVYDVLADDLR